MRSLRLLGCQRSLIRTSCRLSHQQLTPGAARVGGAICTTSTLRESRKSASGEPKNPLHSIADEIDPEGKEVYPAPAETRPFSDKANNLAQGFGFLFDCDGVLYQGGKQIESAAPALRLCRSHDASYLFLTNGGGNTTEAEKAVSLHRKMGVPTEEDLIDGRVIQSHTPFSSNMPFNDSYSKKRLEHTKNPEVRDRARKNAMKVDRWNDIVYTTSLDPDKARAILKGYGFKHVVTAADLLARNEHIFPFTPKQIGTATAEPLPRGLDLWNGEDPRNYDDLDPSKHLKIDHIFVLNDPRDWALETQIIHDILVSHQGFYGTYSKKNGDTSLRRAGWQADNQPRLWISNVDTFWKTEYPMNRYGTGAFLHSLKASWQEVTRGLKLRYFALGKPGHKTYEYAHSQLLGQAEGLRRVYMVGDNPESDIRGALDFDGHEGVKYVPILVKTGVWQETEVDKKPRWEPAVIVDDVLDAVVWAMRQEGIDIDRQTAMEKLSSPAAAAQ